MNALFIPTAAAESASSCLDPPHLFLLSSTSAPSPARRNILSFTYNRRIYAMVALDPSVYVSMIPRGLFSSDDDDDSFTCARPVPGQEGEVLNIGITTHTLLKILSGVLSHIDSSDERLPHLEASLPIHGST